MATGDGKREPDERVRHIYLKIDRAVAHINELQREVDQFVALKPYTAKVQRDNHDGSPVIRFVAVKDKNVGAPHPAMSIYAGEALYHLRSALDHAIHHLVIRNRQTKQISIRTQFPVFDKNSSKNRATAREQIAGVSKAVARVIESEQPYNRFAHAPQDDPLFILSRLNNTDKHRYLSTSVMGINNMNIKVNGRRIGWLESPDVTLKHNKVFFSLKDPSRNEKVEGDLIVAVAFTDAMALHGRTMRMDDLLCQIVVRVLEVLAKLGLPRPQMQK